MEAYHLGRKPADKGTMVPDAPRSMQRRWLQRPRAQRGDNLVELALVAPLLILLIMGTVEAADAYRAYVALSNASREGARLAARGNIFRPDQILLVVREHARDVDLTSTGTVLLTTVKSDTGGFTAYETERLLGSESTHLDQAALATLHSQLTASEPEYLRKEQFVILEIMYSHPTITRFLRVEVPMYAYSVMPVSAPS